MQVEGGKAVTLRRGLIVDSDRVSQYCRSHLFESTLNAYGMITSYRMLYPIQF
jgi:hypothetical protein